MLHVKQWGSSEERLGSNICHFIFKHNSTVKIKFHHLLCLMLLNICDQNIPHNRTNVTLTAISMGDVMNFL